MRFKDRADAGMQLAKLLQHHAHKQDTIVVGLARGGVVVASQIAIALHLPLDVIVVRKLGAPGNEELAIGAVCEQGEPILNESLIGVLGVTNAYLEHAIGTQRDLAAKRVAMYREGRPVLSLQGKRVILVDDGIATGASMQAAIAAVRALGATTIVLAVPVASSDAFKTLAPQVDEAIVAYTPFFFPAVGAFYKVFLQTSDTDVIHLLGEGNSRN